MARIFGESPEPDRKRPKPRTGKPPTITGSQGLLLYIHVPFCRSRCRYCAFHSQVFNQITFDWYLKTLLAEIDLWGKRLGSPKVQTVFFGGGTPSLIQPIQIDSIMDALHKAFSVRKSAEISFEANPDSACATDYYRALISLGVNRLSLGVQSLDDEDLIRLGRPHSSDQAIQAMNMARMAGFGNVSMDLIWGLPRQRSHQWLAQLKNAVELGPDHFSCYGLSIEPGTEFERMAGQMDMELAPEKDMARMYVYGAEYLESMGYLQYEISNFSRMGFTCRHNQGYWEGRDYLGLGPSAVSTIGGRRFRNSVYMDEYDASVRGDFIGRDYDELDKKTRLRELVMLSLRTSKGLSLADYRKMSGESLTKRRDKLIQALHANGLIRINKGRLMLTKNGMLVSNVILERLMD